MLPSGKFILLVSTLLPRIHFYAWQKTSVVCDRSFENTFPCCISCYFDTFLYFMSAVYHLIFTCYITIFFWFLASQQIIGARKRQGFVLLYTKQFLDPQFIIHTLR